jgi:hypothetical protein
MLRTTYLLARPPQLTVWTLESLRLASRDLRAGDDWLIVGVDLTTSVTVHIVH